MICINNAPIDGDYNLLSLYVIIHFILYNIYYNSIIIVFAYINDRFTAAVNICHMLRHRNQHGNIILYLIFR